MFKDILTVKNTIYDALKKGYIIFITGILIYLRFIIFNVMNPDSLIERDDLYYSIDYGWTASLGRYGQAIIGWIFSFRFSSYLFQILSILLISIIIYLIIKMLKIKESLFNLLSIGLIILCSNNFSQILTYNHTSLYYIISNFLMTFAFYILFINKKFILLSAILIAISLSIYQSYIVFAITICLFIIIKDLLNNSFDYKKYISFILAGISGILLYHGSLFLIQLFEPRISFSQVFSANNSLNFSIIIHNILKTYADFYRYFFTNEIIYNSFLQRYLTNFIIVFLILTGTIFLIIKKKINIKNIILLLISFLLIPPVLFMADIIFTNRSILGDTGNLIMPSVNYLYLLLFIIVERIIYAFPSNIKIKIYTITHKIIIIILCFNLFFVCCIFQDCMVNNINCAKNTINIIYNNVKNKYDIDNKKICVIGTLDYGIKTHYKIVKGTIAPYGIAWKTSMFYPCIYSFARIFNNININFIDYNTKLNIEKSEDIQNMPSYPKNGYIKEIDNIIIIKLNK